MTMKAAVCVAAGERRGSDSLWRIGRRSPAPQGWLCPPRGPCRGRNDKSLSPWAQKETASPMSQPEARGPSREEARYPGRRARREYGHGGDGVPVGLEVALRGPQATSTVPCFRRRPPSSRPGTATWRVLTSEQALLPRRPCGGAWLWRPVTADLGLQRHSSVPAPRRGKPAALPERKEAASPRGSSAPPESAWLAQGAQPFWNAAFLMLPCCLQGGESRTGRRRTPLWSVSAAPRHPVCKDLRDSNGHRRLFEHKGQANVTAGLDTKTMAPVPCLGIQSSLHRRRVSRSGLWRQERSLRKDKTVAVGCAGGEDLGPPFSGGGKEPSGAARSAGPRGRGQATRLCRHAPRGARSLWVPTARPTASTRCAAAGLTHLRPEAEFGKREDLIQETGGLGRGSLEAGRRDCRLPGTQTELSQAEHTRRHPDCCW